MGHTQRKPLQLTNSHLALEHKHIQDHKEYIDPNRVEIPAILYLIAYHELGMLFHVYLGQPVLCLEWASMDPLVKYICRHTYSRAFCVQGCKDL